MEQFVRIPSFTFLTLLALEYRIPPCRVKCIFPSAPLTLQWKLSHYWQPAHQNCHRKKKKILPFCFVGSSQCNSISHLSFNLLFIVAERRGRYYPEFPFTGSQQQAPIRAGCLFFSLWLYLQQGQDGSICVSIQSDLPEHGYQQLPVATASTPTRKAC